MANDHRSFDRPLGRPPPDSYRPGSTATSDRYRPESAPRDSTYQPGQRRSHETYRPGIDGRRREPRDQIPNLPPVRSAVTKTRPERYVVPSGRGAGTRTKHERNSNPSTRIHSIKKQLEAPDLPGTVRQERERELAALLFEQEKTKQQQAAKTNLARYHFVRFVERQRAQRELKKLNKQKESCSDENLRSGLEEQIHITNVDLNYTKYAPLGDKYISLFPKSTTSKKPQRVKHSTIRLTFRILTKKQQEQYEKCSNIAPSASGVKPPLWYEIETLMTKGEDQLEALRDGKLTTGRQLKTDLATVGGKEDAQMRHTTMKELDADTPNWLDDDGVIEPADLDSDQDEDMSDGGFFER